MAKKKKQTKKETWKCPDCGHQIVLATATIFDAKLTPDQEPYKSGVIEPVMVDGQEVHTIKTDLELVAHICPNCGFVWDVFKD